VTPYPKIELHVHLDGTVRAPTLRQIAKRNGYPLPDDFDRRQWFRDFREFIEVFESRMGAPNELLDRPGLSSRSSVGATRSAPEARRARTR
jgi:hypothetical protein